MEDYIYDKADGAPSNYFAIDILDMRRAENT
jgi:hypothetical protein